MTWLATGHREAGVGGKLISDCIAANCLGMLTRYSPKKNMVRSVMMCSLGWTSSVCGLRRGGCHISGLSPTVASKTKYYHITANISSVDDGPQQDEDEGGKVPSL